MEHDDFEMDDSGLKGAIQRAWGGERGPQRLRGRISHLLATAGSIDQPAPVAASAWDRWRGRVYSSIAAAVLLFGIGSLVMYYQGFFESPAFAAYGRPEQLRPTKTAIPITLAQSMIATHAACGMHDHHLIDTTTERNYAALSVKLTADLGFPTLARGIGADWTFQGAGECTVEGQRVAHLLFTRGDEAISVFSFALHPTGMKPGQQFEGTLERHAVTGFARPGAMYGIVGSGPAASLSLQTVTNIREILLGKFTPGGCSPEDPLDF